MQTCTALWSMLEDVSIGSGRTELHMPPATWLCQEWGLLVPCKENCFLPGAGKCSKQLHISSDCELRMRLSNNLY